MDKYIKKNVTKSWLISNGFRYSKIFSDEECDVYTYKFPVYKYGDFTILECELIIFLNSGEVRIIVFDCNTRNKYAQFYNNEYGNYDKMLTVINGKIEKELLRLEIEKADNDK